MPTLSSSTVTGSLGWRLRNAAPHMAPWIAAAAAVATFAVGLSWGTNAVGGSDSHCYVGQARMFLDGRLSLAPPLAEPVPWPNAPATFVPSGFGNAAGTSHAVPLCPAGLSLLMAVLMTGADWAWLLVVPLLGALAVWGTYRLGQQLVGPATGAASAVLLALSPVFLLQLFQPMSDVPAAALWTGSLALALRTATSDASTAPRSPDSRDPRPSIVLLASGLLAGLAIMMRPNLALLAVVPLLLVWAGTSGRQPWRAGLGFVGGCVPGVVAVAALQTLIYGSPLRSGYGSLEPLFSLSHVWPNLTRYPSWLVDAHTPVIALALAAPFVLRARRAAWLLLGFGAVTLALYLPYVVFDDWWYTRFLLPALPAMVVLVAGSVRAMSTWIFRRLGPFVFAVVIIGLGAAWQQRAVDLGVFRIQAVERKYPELGRYAATRLPAAAIVLAAQPTGAIRFYARLPTLSWDAIDPAWLDRTVAELGARGLQPYLAIEAWEADAFRTRFGEASALGQLDWPPRATFGRVISVYRFDDRSRYLAGERIPTERVTWPLK